MIHIIITIQPHPLEIVLHKFQTKLTTGPERSLANVLDVYLSVWLRKKATEFSARFRRIP